MEEHGFVHKSVLLYETVGSLNIKPGGIYVDGTLGGGGHAYEVCKRLGGGRLIGIDQDADAIRAAGERLAPFKDKVTIVRYRKSGRHLSGSGSFFLPVRYCVQRIYLQGRCPS